MAGEPIVVQWATLVNYPAGANPWNGNPLKVAPAQLYFTPDIPLPAENLNYELNLITALLHGNSQGVSLSAAANWGQPVENLDPSNILGTVVTAVTWDGYHEQWIAYVWDNNVGATGAEVLGTYDGGKTWRVLTGLHAVTDPTYWAVGVAVDPTNGQFVAVRTNSVVGDAVATVGSETAGTTTTLLGLTTNLGNGSLIADDGGGLFYFIGNDAASPTFAGVGLSYNGTSWTNITTSLPGSWQSATNLVSLYLSEQSVSQIVFAMCGQRPGTDQSRILTIGSFVDCTPSFLTVHLQLRGLAYDAVNQLWGVVTIDDASPPNAKVWTTSDPITTSSTWTLAHTFSGHYAGGLAVIGSVWCVLAQDVTRNGVGNTIYYSGNVTLGATSTLWSRADYFDHLLLSAVTGFPSDQMQSNGSQACRFRSFDSLMTLSEKAGWQPSSSNGL